MAQKKRVVLAFSGGLDTSVILKWLQTELDYEVVCFTADLGQGEELEAARDKALYSELNQNIFLLKISLRSSLKIMFSRCLDAIQFTKVNTCWEHQLQGRSFQRG